MPQGGWTETVAAGRVDLAATVAHVCELALSARSAAHSLESPALLGHCHPLNQFLRSAGPGPAQNASCSIASRMDRTLAIMRRTVSGSACAAVIGTPPPRFLRLLGW
jgi:hypothetical protein